GMFCKMASGMCSPWRHRRFARPLALGVWWWSPLVSLPALLRPGAVLIGHTNQIIHTDTKNLRQCHQRFSIQLLAPKLDPIQGRRRDVGTRGKLHLREPSAAPRQVNALSQNLP